ncbi:hypothetical protein F5Y09DRAFT_337411 [Xylaria sp. FL1042]|nr:hypothetical protein F5Y09DRAFT_337411 [Xylaria sp. FL1042]
MRLRCEYDDGTILSVSAALQKDPYPVRGLVSEAYFDCLAVLPDTNAFVQAEHAVRDALLAFDADQDRYIKPYVMARYLESRMKTTPRANVIQSSFLVGGPLALVGFFHATSNASRNARTHDTLAYFRDCREESRTEMFRRARLFSYQPSAGPWFRQIFDRLNNYHAKALAYLLLAIGPSQHAVLDLLLRRARRPHKDTRNRAIDDLQSIGLLKANPGIIDIDQSLAAFVGGPGPGGLTWWVKAAQVICHAFPKHPLIEPDNREQTEYKILSARLAIQKALTLRGIDRLDLNFASFDDDNRVIEIAAELAILKARFQIDLNSHEKAEEEILSFPDMCTSTLGRITNDQVALERGIIARYKGDFQAAYQLLKSLSPTAEVISHISAVLCEQGQCDKAISMLDGHLQLTSQPNFQLSLAWAQAHLFKCMQALRDGQEYGGALQVASDTYLLLKGVQHSVDAFSIAIGEAILHHIQGNINSAIQGWITALSAFRSYNIPSTYIEILISYSQSDLSFKKYRIKDALTLRDELEILLAKRSPIRRFLSFGSLWPESLNSWKMV